MRLRRAGFGFAGFMVVVAALMVASVGRTRAAEDPWVCCYDANPHFGYLSECKTASPAPFVPGAAVRRDAPDTATTVVYGPAALCGRKIDRVIELVPETGEWRLGATWDRKDLLPSPNPLPSDFPNSSSHALLQVAKKVTWDKLVLEPGRYFLRAQKGAGGKWLLVVYDGNKKLEPQLAMHEVAGACGEILRLNLTNAGLQVCWGNKTLEMGP